MKKVVFLGSKEIGAYCLEALLSMASTADVEVIAVLTNNRSIGNSTKSTVFSIAEENNIPIWDSPTLLENRTDIDFILSVQYHLILNAEQLSAAKEAAINLHMAPLPEYRGCNQFSFAIIDEAKWFGTTLHLMTPGIDDGAILAEKRWPLSKDATVTSLYQDTLEASKQLFENEITSILKGDYKAIPQQELETERGSSFHLRKEINTIKEIDLSWPEEKIDRYIRATYFPPFDPPYAWKNGEKIHLTSNWRNEI